MSYAKPYLQEKSNQFILQQETNDVNANEFAKYNELTVQQAMPFSKRYCIQNCHQIKKH